MIQRYLGNKYTLADAIVRTARNYAPAGSLICDAFTGTLAIALAMKRADYRVAANDVNHFSSIYGRAFLTNSTVPQLDVDALLPRTRRANAHRGQTPEKALRTVLDYLQSARPTAVSAKFRRSHFFDHYTELGARSTYVSSRGRSGRRRFFTPENGRQIDTVLGKIREWSQTRRIDATATALLSAIACDAVEKISNTQGTYHDFPRTTYDPRAFQRLTLHLPDFEALHGKRIDHIIGCGDSLDFVRSVPAHHVLYIDPPYNFRQYTAYYFMPNLICGYAEMDDVDEYFDDVRYVRGQNMRDDFKSTFCSANTFMDSMELLIERADAQVVMLSYFDARNHWNNTNDAGNGIGIRKLTSFLRSSLFRRNSFRSHRFPRLNYQSYGGYRARRIDEFLLVAEKR